MKKIVCGVLFVVFLFTVCAFADAGSAKIQLGTPALVNGKQLPAGNYNVTWTGEGTNVQVTITSADKKSAVTVPAKVVEGAKARTNSVVRNSDGSLKEIWLGGKTQAIVF